MSEKIKNTPTKPEEREGREIIKVDKAVLSEILKCANCTYLQETERFKAENARSFGSAGAMVTIRHEYSQQALGKIDDVVSKILEGEPITQEDLEELQDWKDF